MPIPPIKLNRGVHVMHLFYRVDRARWHTLSADESARIRASLEKLCAAYPGPAQPRLMTFANIGGKADLAFLLYAAEAQRLSHMHIELEALFPPGALGRAYSYLSVTELPEYVTTEDDLKAMLAKEGLSPGTPAFEERFAAAKRRNEEYQHLRLYPELEDWEIMCFYPMNKKRATGENWYLLDFENRKRLMAGHARTGRKFAGRISQLITGSAGLDDWEWGVTLMAHQLDALKEIVYEMRFDDVSARYGEFGPFYVNMRLSPVDLWDHLKL
jgi:peroxiredoxin